MHRFSKMIAVITLAGMVAFDSCAKSASVVNRQVYAKATTRAGLVKNTAYAKDANTLDIDTDDMQRPLDGTEPASAAATLER